ncbi:MAG TPA: alginate export family protein [Nitrospiria bacterium]
MRIALRAVLGLLGVFGIWMVSENAEAAVETERVTIGGELRARYEFRDDADFNSKSDDTLAFAVSRIRLHFGYEIAPDLSFFIQMQDSRLFGSETTTASNEKNMDLHQGYLAVKNLAGPLTVLLGRQEMAFGDHRLVGNVGWSNIGRSFDGLRLNYAAGPVRLDGWAMIVRQYDNAATADPDFTKPSRDGQQFYGLHAAVKPASISVEPYLLYLVDTGNTAGAAMTDPAARGQNRVTAGLRVDGRTAGDAVDFTAEGAYQTGGMESRGTTPKSDVRAYAYAVKAGFTLPAAIKPRIGIEYDRASGDDDPADGAFKTFENLFPTNHMHYGYMDYVGWRNMQDLRVSLGVKPTAVSWIGLDYHRFSLVETADNWYAASGKVFRTTPAANSEKDLGQEVDLVVYGMVKEKLRMEAGYGRFIPGQYVKSNFPSADDPSDFFYVQTSVGF